MSNRHLDVILLCPTEQDTFLISKVLKKDSIDCIAVESIEELCGRTSENVGVLLIAEEALNIQGIKLLNQTLSKQEPWSDIPIILLKSGEINKKLKTKSLETFVATGNVNILERPLRPLTLLSATQVALKARRRQYLVMNLLEAQLQATNIRDEFISIASHELKTPLTSLKLQTQMTKKIIMKPEALTAERVQKQLDYTINQIDRLNKLVDDMLDISRINTGKLQIYKTQFNLSELMEDLIERFLPQFEAVGCEVIKGIEPNVIGEWDPYKIEQVINNLFSNAIRYSPQSRIEINLKRQNGKAILNVKDYGMGIPSEHIARIFDRFERASLSSSGLGLGLYITKQIVELHDGNISVESETNKGANFIVELP